MAGNILDITPHLFFSESLRSKGFDLIRKETNTRENSFILVDENTYHNCYPLLKEIFASQVPGTIVIKSGEVNKTLETCHLIWERMTFSNATRDSLLINLGGGAICDLGGFAASIYKRGIDFIHIPTTLLAQVDASVGGKTGVNFDSFKNQLGTFTNPLLVCIYPGFLKTLPQRHIKNGFAEVIKHGLIADKNYWNEIKKWNPSFILDNAGIIEESVRIKSIIVHKDTNEKGIRKALNFGHTFGHAFETHSLKYSSKPLLHGEAVAMGIICESYLSSMKTGLAKNDYKEIAQYVLGKYPYYSINEEGKQELLRLMMQDKKNFNKQINCTLLKDIGDAVIDNFITQEDMTEVLDYYTSLLK